MGSEEDNATFMRIELTHSEIGEAVEVALGQLDGEEVVKFTAVPVDSDGLADDAEAKRWDDGVWRPAGLLPSDDENVRQLSAQCWPVGTVQPVCSPAARKY